MTYPVFQTNCSTSIAGKDSICSGEIHLPARLSKSISPWLTTVRNVTLQFLRRDSL